MNNNKLNEIERQVEATLLIEGRKASLTGRIITRNFLKGNITKEQAKEMILKKWGVDNGK